MMVGPDPSLPILLSGLDCRRSQVVGAERKLGAFCMQGMRIVLSWERAILRLNENRRFKSKKGAWRLPSFRVVRFALYDADAYSAFGFKRP